EESDGFSGKELPPGSVVICKTCEVIEKMSRSAAGRAATEETTRMIVGQADGLATELEDECEAVMSDARQEYMTDVESVMASTLANQLSAILAHETEKRAYNDSGSRIVNGRIAHAYTD